MAFPLEQRTALVTFRAEDVASRRISGHAAVFNEIANIAGLFDERIAKGAFANVLRRATDVLALWCHESEMLLGRTASKTLRLWEDDRGLAFDLDLPDTTLGRDVLALVQRGDVRGMSFSFRTAREEWDTAANLRTILEFADLFDVSPVVKPAYAGTDVVLRSRDEHLAAEKRSRAARLLNRLALYEALRRKGVES